MKRYIWVLALLMAVCVAAGCSKYTQETAASKEKIAIELANKLAHGDYKGVTEHFDATMKNALGPVQLKNVWELMQAQIGKFKKFGDVRTQTKVPYEIVFISTMFEKKIMEVEFVFNENSEVSGFWIRPAGYREK